MLESCLTICCCSNITIKAAALLQHCVHKLPVYAHSAGRSVTALRYAQRPSVCTDLQYNSSAFSCFLPVCLSTFKQLFESQTLTICFNSQAEPQSVRSENRCAPSCGTNILPRQSPHLLSHVSPATDGRAVTHCLRGVC